MNFLNCYGLGKTKAGLQTSTLAASILGTATTTGWEKFDFGRSNRP
jgi:hypothetical protein